MSDVTAVVLSVDEESTDRAIESVRRQTLQPVETTVVRGVKPFHRALNVGAARVRTEYFIQVDADMILDPTCIEDLRNCMAHNVALVVGHLRDPLIGRLVGIKLFRTRCVQENKLPDSVSPETDFANEISRQGWSRIYALKYNGDTPEEWHIFGEHRPDYHPHLTFWKFAREGAKARHRKAGGGLRGIFRQLHSSTHDLAALATVATAHGIFAEDERDPSHAPFPGNEESRFLKQYLSGEAALEHLPEDFGGLVQRDLEEGFRRGYKLGCRLHGRRGSSDFICCLKQLGKDESLQAWVALVGMCHGLFSEEYVEAQADEALVALRDLLPEQPLNRRIDHVASHRV